MNQLVSTTPEHPVLYANSDTSRPELQTVQQLAAEIAWFADAADLETLRQHEETIASVVTDLIRSGMATRVEDDLTQAWWTDHPDEVQAQWAALQARIEQRDEAAFQQDIDAVAERLTSTHAQWVQQRLDGYRQETIEKLASDLEALNAVHLLSERYAVNRDFWFGVATRLVEGQSPTFNQRCYDALKALYERVHDGLEETLDDDALHMRISALLAEGAANTRVDVEAL